MNLLLMRKKKGGVAPAFSQDFSVNSDLSSWTIPGTAAVTGGRLAITPTLGAEKITNGTMEADANWANFGAPAVNARSSEQAYSGTYSRKMTATYDADGIKQVVSGLTVGAWYKLSGWCYPSAGGHYIAVGFDQVSSYGVWDYQLTAASWQNFFGVRKATATPKTVAMQGSAGDTDYFDGVSMMPITLNTMMAAKNFSSFGVNMGIEGGIHLNSAWCPIGFVVGLDNISNPQNFVIGYILTTDKTFNGATKSLVIEKCVNGTYTTLATYAITYADGKKLRLEREGQIVRAYYDGVQITDDLAVDAVIASGSYAGFFSTDATQTFDGVTVNKIQAYQMGGSSTSVFTLTSKTDIITHAGPNYWCGRPVMCKTASGVWVMAYRLATQHNQSGAGVINVRFSTNEGATWGADNTFTDSSACSGVPFTAHTPNTDAAEVLLITCPNGDLLAHVWENDNAAAAGTHQYRSTDAGKTWTADFSGTVINSDARLRSAQDWFVKAGVIYVTFEVCPTAADRWARPHYLSLYKSSDNGATWVETVVNNTLDNSESGIANISGNNLLITMRDGTDGETPKTYRYRSSDMGATWSGQETMPTNVGMFQRPRLRPALGGVIMVGRDDVYNPDNRQYTGIWYSPDGGITWTRHFRPDATAYGDSAYCDLMIRNDGTFYLLTYHGASMTGANNIQACVFAVTP